MPTSERLPRFDRDFGALSDDEKDRFRVVIRKFVEDLEAGGMFRAGLRVKGIQSAKGIYEMSWEGDGRATFQFGEAIHEGEPHIVWRRIGDHRILDDA